MGIVETRNLVFEYIRRDEDGNADGITRAIDGVTLDIKKGQFIAILGGNGSGKSTLAKHINAILFPTEGAVYVNGKDTSALENLWDVRQEAGMVFQNPDNQIIANVVEEDVGFGPENMGVPTEEIWARVDESLKAVGMETYRKHSPNRLSGGQKQRVAIAGVLAMHPKCIIMDEPTAMLDPEGRYEVIRAARALNQVENVTIILITHYMNEVVFADQVYVMDHGRVAMRGTPREIFSKVDELKRLRLDVPQPTLLAHALQKKGMAIPNGILDRKEFVDSLKKVMSAQVSQITASDNDDFDDKQSVSGNLQDALILDHVSYTYSTGTADEIHALNDISLKINKGEFIGLIGHTGSGKSTFVQHLNGIIKATSGHVYYKGRDIYDKSYNLKELRSHVGLVFQYPEHQLFEETVFKDVCFGPKNLGLSDKEAELRAFEALKAVRLTDEYFYVSPFELSGGQKRRVAIAGVLAMKPDILILDEPTAGLDPQGRDEILDLVKSLREEQNITVILVSHSMEDVANYVDRILVLEHGSILMDGTPREVFRQVSELERIGLRAPEVTYIMRDLRESGIAVNTGLTTVPEAAQEIMRAEGRIK